MIGDLEFERPITDLRKKIDELKRANRNGRC